MGALIVVILRVVGVAVHCVYSFQPLWLEWLEWDCGSTAPRLGNSFNYLVTTRISDPNQLEILQQVDSIRSPIPSGCGHKRPPTPTIHHQIPAPYEGSILEWGPTGAEPNHLHQKRPIKGSKSRVHLGYGGYGDFVC